MRKIIEIANNLTDTDDSREYTLTPKTDPDKIGIHWFKAAEIFIKELASKAYMTYKYEKLNVLITQYYWILNKRIFVSF